MQTYELTYIIGDSIADSKTHEIAGEVSGQIEGLGGVIIKEEPWGKRRLAYSIGKSQYGSYITLQMHLDGAKVSVVERFLTLHPAIIRSLLRKSAPKSAGNDQSEVAEALTKRVEAKKAKATTPEQPETKARTQEIKPMASEKPSAPIEETIKPKPTRPTGERTRKSASNEAEKKQESEEERKKLVEEKLSEILGE